MHVIRDGKSDRKVWLYSCTWSKVLSIAEKSSNSAFPLIYELQYLFGPAHMIAVLLKFLKLPSPEMMLRTGRSWCWTCLTALTPQMTHKKQRLSRASCLFQKNSKWQLLCSQFNCCGYYKRKTVLAARRTLSLVFSHFKSTSVFLIHLNLKLRVACQRPLRLFLPSGPAVFCFQFRNAGLKVYFKMEIRKMFANGTEGPEKL